MATFRKRQSNGNKPEPITLTITLLTLSILIIGKVFGDDFKGKIWIYAKTNDQDLSHQSLTLRDNNTYRVDLHQVDFTCYFSGNFKKLGDTILLDKSVIEQTHSLLTEKYLIGSNSLVPLPDTNKNGAKINELVIWKKR